MVIGGLQKFSLLDYPGYPAAVLFTVGCNMRCGYCHNPELVLPEQYTPAMPIEAVIDFLNDRRQKLEAVVITGGEPTMHADLLDFMATVKALGYRIKLDSNGTHPEVLTQAVQHKLVDYFAMDIKGPLKKYQAIAGRPVDLMAIQDSIRIILSSGLPHEFRTTVVKCLLPPDDFHEIGALIRGAQNFAIQRFVPNNTLNPTFLSKTTYNDNELLELKKIMKGYVYACTVR